jgi:hypothetical protein
MIDVEEANGARNMIVCDVTEAGQKRPRVIVAFDESVNRIAVSSDAGCDDPPVLVAMFGRFVDTACASGSGFSPCLTGVVNPKRNNTNAVAVLRDMTGNFCVWAKSGRQHKAYLALLEDIGRAIALAGLGTCISDELHTESGAVEISRLTRITDIELDVISTLERKKICRRSGM